MTIPTEVRPIVRERANFVCEYCGVRESDVGGELTIDHFDPRSHGGMDHPDNLQYCCQRCNEYKAAYFPSHAADRHLWNPRRELFSVHFLVLEDGLLHPRTSVGVFTIQRLRLDRPQLVAYRRRRREWAERERLLAYYRDLLNTLERLYQQQQVLLNEQRALLAEQRALIASLLDQEG